MKTIRPLPPLRPRPNRVRILLCGYGHLGLALLDGLLACADSCEIVGVFRWSARPASHCSWEPVEADFQKRVRENGLPDVQCQGMNAYEFVELLQERQPDVVLVGSWGEILRPHLLENSAPLLINCHPSKLPAHRGANPYSSVIRAGETKTGVTFHLMAAQIDAGAIVLQQSIPLNTEDNGALVRDRCAQTAQALVPELVRLLHQHVVEGAPLPQHEQDHSQQSYFKQLKAEDGAIDWEASEEDIKRQMRGLFPWIACYGVLPSQRPILFYDPRFVPGSSSSASHLSPPHPAGTILSNRRGIVQIALSTPQTVLEVSHYQFGQPGRGYYWPLWLSRLLSPFILRPGLRFMKIPTSKATLL